MTSSASSENNPTLSPLPLEVFPVRGATAFDKAQGIVQAFGDIWGGTVLDVGCRSRELLQALTGYDVDYIGVDLHEPADVIVDLGLGLPFADRHFDVVVALDVLEHTDDAHLAFDECCRVAQRAVVISLPNAYEARARIRHLRGDPISAKYGLPTERPVDRHRWFFSLTDARSFVGHRASASGWSLSREGLLAGPRLRRLLPLAKRWPNVLASTYVALLSPTTR